LNLIEIIEKNQPKKPSNFNDFPGKKEEKFEIQEEKKEGNEPILFYNTESNMFPLGQSVFMPSNRKAMQESNIIVLESMIKTNLAETKNKK